MKCKIRYQYLFPEEGNGFWNYVLEHIEGITEIRIRVNRPILINYKQKEITLDEDGNFLYGTQNGIQFEYIQLQKLINYWCMDSRYAFQEEIKRGYITIKGGHRIGICGESVMDHSGQLQSIKYISSINIRIAHEIKQVSNPALPYIFHGDRVKNTLIVAPPGMGKTTLLRDLLRVISDGEAGRQGKNVALVDERGEIAACFQGIPQLDVGNRTDVLAGCEKLTGMRMLLQAMGPEIIAVDELVSNEERELLHHMMNRGCAVIATMHGEEEKESERQKKWYEGFETLIFLSKKEGKYITKIYGIEEGIRCNDYWEQYSSL